MMKKLIAALLLTSCIATAHAQSTVIERMTEDPSTACVTMAAAYANGIAAYGFGHESADTLEVPAVVTDPGDKRLWVDLANAGLLTIKEQYEQMKADAANETGTFSGKVVLPEREAIQDIGGMVYKQLEFACAAARHDLSVITALPNLSEYVYEVIRTVSGGARGVKVNFIKVQSQSTLPIVPKKFTSGQEEDAWYAAFYLRVTGCIQHNWPIWILQALEQGASKAEAQMYAVDKAIECMAVEKPAKFKEDYLSE